ncbi:hypothetical protein [Burkholderia plantarii]|uniref:hypothetical protein n=1 Tax=Burkholderia plantarii TaxID=41899 RepID=UPI0011DF585E|nr:hypothetical protein [Burkholderia plantarii]
MAFKTAGRGIKKTERFFIFFIRYRLIPADSAFCETPAIGVAAWRGFHDVWNGFARGFHDCRGRMPMR